ncbi:MAG: TlpA family protein disulfide reductase [Chitinophagaceae bacterium]|nr:MAG: TlpA family protein disulfide reductase [Chitinophagaceae bacterium]
MRLVFSFILFQLVFTSYGQISRTIDLDSLFEAKNREAVGKPFPKFVAKTDKGEFNSDSLVGKVVLINFWFEGCHPCIAEFPALNELADKLKGNKDFQFISFTWDNPETIKRVKDKYNLQFKVLSVDPNECRRLNGNNGYPTTIILDRKGIIRYLTLGGSTDSERAIDFVMNTLLPKLQKEL